MIRQLALILLSLSLPALADPLSDHIDALWPALIRDAEHPPPESDLLPLPKPYVVPGGRFAELYYWDSYFTMLGLAESGQNALIGDMIADFSSMLRSYGHIPNGNRSYYLSRSQPPFFFAMVQLADPEQGFARHLDDLKREYRFWMEHRLAQAPRLNHYDDALDTPRPEQRTADRALAKLARRPPAELYHQLRAAAESGWDFSSRWGRDKAATNVTDILPIDLNSLLYGLEQAIEIGCRQLAETACAEDFAARKAARRRAIDAYLWDASAGAYLDYSRREGRRHPAITAATLYPLFVGLADQSQAAAVAVRVRDDLLREGGVVTTTKPTGEQWDYPNGWAPLQWIAIAGLRRYGEERLAAAIACRWIVLVERVYAQTGRLVEKYDVVATDRPGGGGEYPVQDGFGWTNGVTRKLLALYPEFADLRQYERCPQPVTSSR